MEKGTLIEFRLRGERRLAVLERPEGKKNWIAIDGSGQSHTIHPRQIDYSLPGDYTAQSIPGFCARVDDYLDPSSLEVAWELLGEEGESTDAAGLASLLFGESEPPQRYAAHCLLCDDKIYFKQKGDRYEPRSQVQVAELKHQIEVEARKQQEWQEFLSRTRAALNGESVEWTSGDRLRVDALEKFAVFGEEAPQKNSATEVLAALDRPPTDRGAFELLVDLKLWSPHENLFLRRTQIPIHFPQEVLDVAQRYLDSPPPDRESERLDLTHLKVYTIDDASTQEIDDGLSVEELEDGRQRLWIHIADPTRWLSPGDELDLEARRRCTTVYLPTGMAPMLPAELATGPMSLNQGQTSPALSFAVILDEAGAVAEYAIHPTLVRPTYRLTYDDADEMLELGIRAEPELLALGKWSQQRRRWRQSQGSISIHMPEASIKVRDDEVTIEILDDSQARELVAEMMILAGEVAARYARDREVPVPFRQQPQPELPPDEELMLLPPGPVRSCAIRRCMPRSEIGLVPGRHASLGLDLYMQVTSPIRRYIDLVAHFQIKAHLRGDPLPFSDEQLREIVASSTVAIKEAVLVERQTSRYWTLEYLRRHPEEVWQVLMLRWIREDDRLASILFEELGVEMLWRFSRDVRVGERLQLRVVHVDPRSDAIQFQEVARDRSDSVLAQ